MQDSYRLMPWADALYGCDPKWWEHHGDCNGFAGERWSVHDPKDEATISLTQAEAFGVRIVRGEHGDIFSTDPEMIRYGSNSGFQAINLAILKGCRRIVLVGFDMQSTGGNRHFFGDHPKGMNRMTRYEDFLPRFETAARHMPPGIKIVNATTQTALYAFPVKPLDEALAANLRGSDCCVHRDRAELEPVADCGSTG